MNYITPEYIIEQNPELQNSQLTDWTLRYDTMSGCIGWDNQNRNIILWATPNFVEEGVTAVALQDEFNGQYVDLYELVFQTNSSLEEQYEFWMDSIKKALHFI
jgi:hypothetical protein